MSSKPTNLGWILNMNREQRSSFVFQVTTLVAITAMTVGSGCCVTGSCGGSGPLFATHGGGTTAGCDLCTSGCDSCSTGSEVVIGGGCSGGAFPGSCGTCASGCGGGLSGMFLPLLSTRLACGAGCGGVYWNEWISDPPECCDPCDNGGCWVGPQCGNCPNYGCGPCGLVSGAWHGITGLFTNFTTSAWLTGVGGQCGCAECTGTVGMGCDSPGGCGIPGCTDCVQQGPSTPDTITTWPSSPIPQGPIATTAQVQPTLATVDASSQDCADCATAGTIKRHPHRVVSKRLRR